MPTPFSHMATITQLLSDDTIPAPIRQQLNAEHPAYVLGSVAPDARIDAPDSRAATHFYKYTEPMDDHPWRVMLNRYPALTPPNDAAHRAFLAGYVAHLAMDEVWTLDMLAPHFAAGDWGQSLRWRFFVLHLLLIQLDDRDLGRLPGWVPDSLWAASPDDWLPFMPPSVMQEWQQLIYDQIKPDGASQTLHIFGHRVGRAPAELRGLVDDADWMQRELWQHVPPHVVEQVEQRMYTHARDSLVRFMREYG